MKKNLLSIAFVFALAALPAPTLAAGLTGSQIQAILSLLSSFGADSSVVSNVSASLNNTNQLASVAAAGQGSSSSASFSHTWDTDLELGSPYTTDVTALQFALHFDGEFNGQANGDFNAETYIAVKAFQAKYGIITTGYVGPLTRTKLNELY